MSSFPSYGSSAPNYGSSAPSYGSSAPNYGSSAPNYGSSAPSYGSSAPRYGSQPIIDKTPSPPHERSLDDMTCQICVSNEKNVVFFPCGHLTCNVCCQTLTKCPFCRTNIERKNKVFLGGFKQKYLKYKQKYLELKKEMNII
jgi:hypothetical protein